MMERDRQKHKLPEGWSLVNITDISCIEDNLRKAINNFERQERTEGKSILDLYPYYGATGQVGWIDDYLTDGEYILIGEDGAPFLDSFKNKAYVIKGKAWVNNHAHVIKVNKYVSQKFLLHYLNQFDYRDYINGTTRLKLTKKSLSTFLVPLPPLKEQQGIVSKIEALFSELEHAEKNLQVAKQLLESYRQALLKKAFSGELSKKWRNENLEENIKQEKKLPLNWKYQKITNLTNFVGSGSTPKGGRNIYTEDGIPFIRSQNVLVNRLIEDDLVFISSKIHEKMKRTHTKPKDILLNITGASIGRCTYIHENFIEGNVNQHVCIIRVNHKMIHYKYLTFFLNSPEAQLRIKQINTGATREALTLSQIKDFEIPVCGIAEQDFITQTLESQFTLIDSLNDTINKNFEEVVSLRYSILKKAFDGKLVNQEPTDEPVQKLLEFIKKEKIEYLKNLKETLLQKPKRIIRMDSNKTVWQILSSSKIAMRTDKLWSESIHKDDIDAFYAEVKELIDSGKIVEEKRQGKVSYLKVQ